MAARAVLLAVATALHAVAVVAFPGVEFELTWAGYAVALAIYLAPAGPAGGSKLRPYLRAGAIVAALAMSLDAYQVRSDLPRISSDFELFAWHAVLWPLVCFASLFLWSALRHLDRMTVGWGLLAIGQTLFLWGASLHWFVGDEVYLLTIIILLSVATATQLAGLTFHYASRNAPEPGSDEHRKAAPPSRPR